MRSDFPVLRVIAWVYKAFGVLVFGALVLMILSFFAALPALGTGSVQTINTPFGILSFGLIIYAAIIGISLYAVGEFIELILKLEENTRATNRLLETLGADRYSRY